MESTEYIRFFVAFLFVMGLIGLMGWALRRYGSGRPGMGRAAESGLATGPARMVDNRHRMQVLRWHDEEYLVLLGSHAAPLLLGRRRTETKSGLSATGEGTDAIKTAD